MPIIDPNELVGIEKPELVFGLVAAVGTPLLHVSRILEEELGKREYNTEDMHISSLLEGIELNTAEPEDKIPEFDRIKILMDRGNELRAKMGGGEALALLAVAKINSSRSKINPAKPGYSYILRQLKHPDEVLWLRKIYGSAFHLIGVYCSEKKRKENLMIQYGMPEDDVCNLISRDRGEDNEYGQQLRDTYYLSDVFIEMGSVNDIRQQLQRYIKLMFAEEIITPSSEEYGMHLAYASSLRSADLSRQVGAAIISEKREVLSVGTNEVPAPEGGQYWEDTEGDARDFKLGFDYNAKMKRDILREILQCMVETYKDDENKEEILELAEKRLSDTRLMNLTEFGRAVHAEMEAILSAGRKGLSVVGSQLYTTTFPCHNCAKHIVGAGIKRVIYIEPYPKSLAQELHNDSIVFSEDNAELNDNKTIFEPFVGVAPTMYWKLFSLQTAFGDRLKRKNKRGEVIQESSHLRLFTSPLSYIDREVTAAVTISAKMKDLEEGTDEK